MTATRFALIQRMHEPCVPTPATRTEPCLRHVLAGLIGLTQCVESRAVLACWARKSNKEVVVSKMETTTAHGALIDKTQTSQTNFYNLDAVISVGYRVNSRKATNFRIWATKVLREYMIKGFAMDDDRGSTARVSLA